MKQQELINELKSAIAKIKEEILHKEELLDSLQEQLENLNENL